MTIDEKQMVVMAIHNLVFVIEQLAPDSEYAEMYGIPEVQEQAKKALDILTKEGE
jgi:hypothetical protein